MTMAILTTQHYNKTVGINARRPLDASGVAASKGAYLLERIDRQRIEEELVKFAAAIMAGRGRYFALRRRSMRDKPLDLVWSQVLPGPELDVPDPLR